MCRIAGIFNNAYSIEELGIMVSSMCKNLQHGGPDDEGFYTTSDGHFCLGHRRLTIIDTSYGGHQPMMYADGRYVISYNGELYNYKKIRDELKGAGWDFKTSCDTEVVLAAFAAWGTASFERFEGMFAFALLDNSDNEIYLVRDAGGIKPLYYALTNNGLAFASEVGALNLVPYLKETNTKWPAYLMAYGHLPEPITTLKHVRPIEKGTFLAYNLQSKTATVKSFFKYRFIEKINNRSDAEQLIRNTLETAVEQHLISDTPIGVFLSGGLDSSIIAMLANKHQHQLKTVSLYFDNTQYSEKKYQDALKEKLNCSHQQYLLKEEDFHICLPDIIRAMDLPCCDGINTWFISKFAKDSGLKAVLSGVGGDELYGGYPSFRRMKTALSLAGLPQKLLRTGRFASSKKLKRLAFLSIGGPIGTYLFLRGQFIPSEIAKFLGAEEKEIWHLLEEQPATQNISYLTPKNQASWLETNLYMQNQLLRDADVMSMAHGLEIRLPFLDKSFMELSLKISSSVKYNGSRGKQLLIDSFRDQLPRIVWDRPKMGFSFPFKEWLSNEIYSGETGGGLLAAYHNKLKNNDMHWSQFFTLQILQQFSNGR